MTDPIRIHLPDQVSQEAEEVIARAVGELRQLEHDVEVLFGGEPNVRDEWKWPKEPES